MAIRKAAAIPGGRYQSVLDTPTDAAAARTPMGQPAAAQPAGWTGRLLSQFQSPTPRGLSNVGADVSGRPADDILRAFGPEAASFYSSGGYDPNLLANVTSRLGLENDSRRRGNLLQLAARGADQPGAYGTAALLSDLTSSSDLTQAQNAAQLQQEQGVQEYKRKQLDDLLAFLRELAIQRRGAAYGITAQQNAQQGQQHHGFGVSYGPQGLGLSFADGGIVDQPTHAIIGDGGEPEAVIPVSKLLALFSGTYDPGTGQFMSPEDQHQHMLGSALGGGPAVFGGDLIRGRADRAAQGRGTLTGRTMEGPAGQVTPTPFAEPPPVKPQGILEHLARLPIHIDAGPRSSGFAKGLAALFGLGAGIGSERLKEKEARRAGVSKYVGELNAQQRTGIRSSSSTKKPTDLEYVPETDSYERPQVADYAKRVRIRNANKPPKATKPPAPAKPDADIGRLVSESVRRLNGAKTREELDAVHTSIGSTNLTRAQIARLDAAWNAAQARLKAAGF